jgi:catechol 2,3-dioxygenase-like lactoylglutathione lyase family enzyme
VEDAARVPLSFVCFVCIEELEDGMKSEGVLMNVADLSRSIDFYREVFGFTLRTQEEQLAVVGVSESDPTQVIVLRAFGSSPMGGARHIGLRAFLLEAESADQFERVASEMDSRRVLVGRRDHSEWTAVVARDPDEVTVVLVWHPEGKPSTDDGWRVLDDFLYGVGE